MPLSLAELEPYCSGYCSDSDNMLVVTGIAEELAMQK